MEGESMSEWKEVRLGDVCNIFGRIGFRGYTINDLVSSKDEGAISLSPTNIIDGEINVDKCSYISWNKYYESPEIMIFKNDILIVKTGSSYGRTALVKEVKHQMTINPQFVVLKNININPIYLSYYIKSKTFQNQISSIVVGSAIPTLSQKNLANLYLKIQGSQTQQEIAGILSSLDAKIETNNKLNEKLEEMAQAIFKSWFVDFEPFKDKPFHETELGMIPEGWEVGSLSDIATITMGQSPRGTSYNENGEGIIFYQGRTEFGFRFPSIRLYTTAPSRFAEVGSTLMSVRAPVGDINMALLRCCIGRGVASIKSNCDCDSYIYYLMKSLKKRFDIYNGEGTVFGSVGRDTLRGLLITIPPSSVISDFEMNISKIDSRIKTNELESQRLASLRDTLLPRLMSGELIV